MKYKIVSLNKTVQFTSPTYLQGHYLRELNMMFKFKPRKFEYKTKYRIVSLYKTTHPLITYK